MKSNKKESITDKNSKDLGDLVSNSLKGLGISNVSEDSMLGLYEEAKNVVEVVERDTPLYHLVISDIITLVAMSIISYMGFLLYFSSMTENLLR